MPRVRDLGVRVGLLEPGPANSITDVAGVGVGHANHTPDHVGVTVVVPRSGDDLWLHPFPAAAASLNGSGEIAGLAQVQEWGIAETPIFLTATTYVGAVYDAVTQVLHAAQPRLGVDDVVIPVVAECDPCDYCDVRDGARPDVGLVAAALATASADVAEGQVGAGVGMSCFDMAGGIGTSSRVAGRYCVGVLVLANFGSDPRRLTVAGRSVADLLPVPDAPGSEGSCVTRRSDRCAAVAVAARAARPADVPRARRGSGAMRRTGRGRLPWRSRLRIARRSRGTVSTKFGRSRCWRTPALDELFAGVVEATEEAVLNSLCAGRELTGATGRVLPAFPVGAVAARVRGGPPHLRRSAADRACYSGSSSKISTAHFPSPLERNGRPSVRALRRGEIVGLDDRVADQVAGRSSSAVIANRRARPERTAAVDERLADLLDPGAERGASARRPALA